MSGPRVVVTGGNGVLGRALRALLPDAAFLGRDACDVRDPASVQRALWHAEPEVVLHAAALTDHAHPNAAEIIETNIFGTEYVARWCRAAGVRLVYTSTHYVYPGETGRYRETDPTRPIGAYAWSKLAGERWAAIVPDACVVRGSWYSYRTRVATWLARGVLTDAWCSREPVEVSARKLARLALSDVSGIVNIGGPRRTFAQLVADEGYTATKLVTRAQLALAYPFPADTSVNTAKYDALATNLPEV